MQRYKRFITETWSPTDKSWPPKWTKITKSPTPDQWTRIWTQEVPTWHHTTQKQYQDLAMSEIRAAGADPVMSVTALAFRYYSSAFHSYFKQRWGVSIPNDVHRKIMTGEGTVKWGGEKYSTGSETRELCFAMITEKQ